MSTDLSPAALRARADRLEQLHVIDHAAEFRVARREAVSALRALADRASAGAGEERERLAAHLSDPDNRYASADWLNYQAWVKRTGVEWPDSRAKEIYRRADAILAVLDPEAAISRAREEGAFWVIERRDLGPQPRYWAGSSKDFWLEDIGEAIKFYDRPSADRIWADRFHRDPALAVVEHAYVSALPLSPSQPSSTRVSKEAMDWATSVLPEVMEARETSDPETFRSVQEFRDAVSQPSSTKGEDVQAALDADAPAWIDHTICDAKSFGNLAINGHAFKVFADDKLKFEFNPKSDRMTWLLLQSTDDLASTMRRRPVDTPPADVDAAVAGEREAIIEIARSELRNTDILLSHPPQSSAAWNIIQAIRARSAAPSEGE